jgi:hypothetical protein
MSDEILARRKRSWDSSRPVQGVDNLVTSPRAGVLSPFDKALVVDFELKLLLGSSYLQNIKE